MFRRILRLATSVAMLCLVACSDDNPLGGSVSPESSETPVVSGESSSSVAGTSSDDVGGSAANVASSSENVTMSSSSVTANSSSSAKAPKNTAACMWKGTDEYVPVKTGLDPDDKYGAGYWYNFGDSFKGGKSFIEFPINDDDQLNEWENIVRLIGECGGYCGAFILDRGSANEAYAGFGFNVAGVVDPSEGDSPVAKADISEWGGLCVTYASDADLEVVLAYAQESGFGNLSRMPKMTLPKSVKLKTVCADWNKFMTVFSEVSTTFMTSILFAVQGDANTKSRFNIRGLGKYSEKTNFCSPGDDPFVSGKMGLVIP